MKLVHITFIFFFVVGILACNDRSHIKTDTAVLKPVGDTVAEPANLKRIVPQFPDVDPSIRSVLSEAVDSYLLLKNALADGDETLAKSNGRAMAKALAGLDKTKFSAVQEKAFVAEEDELIENAEHIAKSGVSHQRSHFSTLSQHFYNVLITFKIHRPLYVAYCDKVPNGDMVMWLTQAMDHKNPYLGGSKEDCFNVREKIE
jgi:hypothetical protein